MTDDEYTALIDKITDQHQEQDGHCATCRTVWPCAAIRCADALHDARGLAAVRLELLADAGAENGRLARDLAEAIDSVARLILFATGRETVHLMEAWLGLAGIDAASLIDPGTLWDDLDGEARDALRADIRARLGIGQQARS